MAKENSDPTGRSLAQAAPSVYSLGGVGGSGHTKREATSRTSAKPKIHTSPAHVVAYRRSVTCHETGHRWPADTHSPVSPESVNVVVPVGLALVVPLDV